MSLAIRPHKSIQSQLHAAICLLGLITSRPVDLDNLAIQSSELEEDRATSTDDAKSVVEDLQDDEIDTLDDDQNRDIDNLRNKVLDRLAEILARYKTALKRSRGGDTILDPKHVSSTMMITYKEEKRVKILCSKNEGLDQGKSIDDTEFLKSWTDCMQRISRAGIATEEDKAVLYDLILKYNQPRISYYVNELKEAFRFGEPAKDPTPDMRPVCSDVWLRKLPTSKYRIWIDDSGNEFKFVTHSPDEADQNSKVAVSAQTLRNIDDEVSSILRTVDKLIFVDTGTADDSRQEALLKELLPNLFAFWRSVRFQSSLNAQLCARFRHSQHLRKALNKAVTALKFLCRCYYAVVTFIKAAEAMQIFQNIECVAVPAPPRPSKAPKSKNTGARGAPLETAKSIGIYLSGIGWMGHLEKQTTKTNFQKLRGEACHVHAEIQLLAYQDSLAMSAAEQGKIHPYIGCSKRCCLLCWLFIRLHGTFDVRGGHETVINRWKIPAAATTEPANPRFLSIADGLLNVIREILQILFNQPYPLKHLQLLTQSSAALSTTQTVLDQEKAEMERSQLRTRQIMMGQSVTEHGLMILENHQKPGHVYVYGGPNPKPMEMTCQEAEIYRENHIRGKFGLEKTDQMPPKQSSVARYTCSRCHLPSSLRCSACRTHYCSKHCQKRDWRRHVFICTINNRPNSVDHLKLIMKRWTRSTKPDSRRHVLLDLYSDDDLCKTFGFNNCFDSGAVANLLCFYSHMISKLTQNGVQAGIDGGNLGDFMDVFANLTQYDRGDSYCDCACFTWFLGRRANGDEIPDWDHSYAYQIIGLRRAESVLSVRERVDDVYPLSAAEKGILAFYSILFRDFNNIPSPLNSQWLLFGFCFCTNHGQRIELAKLYLQLAEGGASIKEIAYAFESNTLSALMKSRGLDVSFLEAHNIMLHMPDLNERGIYRFVAEVSHALSGRFCYCFLSKPNCHPKFETHLSCESDGDYGFHGTNAWERWQLLNFFKYVFELPGFKARKMQEAKRNSDRGRLDQYLDSLVPGFTKKIGNVVLSDFMFPKLKASVSFPHGRPECHCVVHNTIAPEGLNWATFLEVSRYRPGMAGAEAENVEIETTDQHDS